MSDEKTAVAKKTAEHWRVKDGHRGFSVKVCFLPNGEVEYSANLRDDMIPEESLRRRLRYIEAVRQQQLRSHGSSDQNL